MNVLQNQGPLSDVIMKLVFPYLDLEELLKTGDLVCRSWRDVLLGDDVWRPICDNNIKNYTKLLLEARQYPTSYYHDQEYYCDHHEVLTKNMNNLGEHGRSCREISIISQRVGRLLSEHKCNGPDIPSREYALDGDEDD